MAKLANMENFYNRFHKSGSIQAKVINGNNFTYRGAIGIYKELINHKESLNILDFGCGVGTISLYLANQGNKVMGVDISQKAIDLAKKNAKATGLDNITEFQALKSWRPIEHESSFDIVISLEVIEHISNDTKLLLSFNKYLKKNGILLLSTPTLNAPLYRLGLLKKFDKEVGHLRRYNIEELKKIIHDSGFKIILVKKTEGILRNSLYVFPELGFLVRFIRGPISDLVTFLDQLSISLFGESNVHILATKK